MSSNASKARIETIDSDPHLEAEPELSLKSLPQVSSDKPNLPFLSFLGVLALLWSSSIYSGFGMAVFPRQEWLLETLVSAVFLIPVVNLLVLPGRLSRDVRMLGAALLLHSCWDALHLPSLHWVQTPIDPRFPLACPYVDIVLGFLLLIRGR